VPRENWIPNTRIKRYAVVFGRRYASVVETPATPTNIGQKVEGSGADGLITFTVALAVVAEIDERVESSRIGLKMFTDEDPVPITSNSAIASFPEFEAPLIALVNVSAVEEIVPNTLSITPGTKNVIPPAARKPPSLIETASSLVGSKPRSNCQA